VSSSVRAPGAVREVRATEIAKKLARDEGCSGGIRQPPFSIVQDAPRTKETAPPRQVSLSRRRRRLPLIRPNRSASALHPYYGPIAENEVLGQMPERGVSSRRPAGRRGGGAEGMARREGSRSARVVARRVNLEGCKLSRPVCAPLCIWFIPRDAGVYFMCFCRRMCL